MEENAQAYAAVVFTEQLLRALKGEKGIIAPTFVRSPLYEKQGVEFFASNVELGTNGVAKIQEIGKISSEEQKLLDACLPELSKVRYLSFLYTWDRVSDVGWGKEH